MKVSIKQFGAVLLLVAMGLVLPAIGAGASGTLSLITEPNQGMAPIYALLSSPKKTLDMTMYEFHDSAAEQILAADAKRGVKVRVMLDKEYVGTYNQPTFTWLKAHGVQVHWASTQVALTHEKSFVVDGKTAAILTLNLTSQYYSSSRDFAVVDSNKADVAAIESTFRIDWNDGSGTAPGGSDLVWSPGSQAMLVSLIGSARHSLVIENEEMDDSTITNALEAAAKRGVRVDVVMTRSSSWVSAFDALVRSGVAVRTYSESASLYIHAKVIVVDNDRVFLGSENFSVESLQYNRELGLITSSASIVNGVSSAAMSDFDGATPWKVY